MGTPFLGYPTGLTADQSSAIAKFDAEFPDMQKKMNYLSSVPNLSPQLLKEYYDIKSEFSSFESANSKTNITFANADKISVCSRLQSMKTKIDNLYNLVSGMAMYNPLMARTLPTVVTTITTTPVPTSQGTGSLSSDTQDTIASLRSMGILWINALPVTFPLADWHSFILFIYQVLIKNWSCLTTLSLFNMLFTQHIKNWKKNFIALPLSYNTRAYRSYRNSFTKQFPRCFTLASLRTLVLACPSCSVQAAYQLRIAVIFPCSILPFLICRTKWSLLHQFLTFPHLIRRYTCRLRISLGHLNVHTTWLMLMHQTVPRFIVVDTWMALRAGLITYTICCQLRLCLTQSWPQLQLHQSLLRVLVPFQQIAMIYLHLFVAWVFSKLIH